MNSQIPLRHVCGGLWCCMHVATSRMALESCAGEKAPRVVREEIEKMLANEGLVRERSK